MANLPFAMILKKIAAYVRSIPLIAIAFWLSDPFEIRAQLSGDGGSPSFASSPPSSDNEVVKLDKVVVGGGGADGSVLPDRPTDSALGLSLSVQDTPRSVYEI